MCGCLLSGMLKYLIETIIITDHEKLLKVIQDIIVLIFCFLIFVFLTCKLFYEINHLFAVFLNSEYSYTIQQGMIIF